MAKYRRDQKQDEWNLSRLKEAVDQYGGGNAEAFAKLIGYANGGFIREVLSGLKPVGKAIITRVHEQDWGKSWFGVETIAAASAMRAIAAASTSSAIDSATARLSREALTVAQRIDALEKAQRPRVLALVDAILAPYDTPPQPRTE